MTRLADRIGVLAVILWSNLASAQTPTANYKADFDRLKEINQMYGNPAVLENQPDIAVAIIKQLPAARDERQRITTKYADLLKQNSPDARAMNTMLRHCDDVWNAFDRVLSQYVSNAPTKINADIDDALKSGQDAVNNKRFAYFGEGGGVPQRLGWAQTKLNVLEAADPAGAPTAQAKQKLESARQQIVKMQESLLDSIVQANRLPAETYKDADKAQLIDLIKSKWATSGIADPVQKMGINSKAWQRDTRWEWDKSIAWSKVDKSRIQGFVVVKHEDKVAIVHYVNLVKDHQAQDKIEAFFLDDPKAEPTVARKVLITNVK